MVLCSALKLRRTCGRFLLALYCHSRECSHRGMLDVSAYPGGILVQAFRGRVVVSYCGSRDVDVRPDWTEIGQKGRA